MKKYKVIDCFCGAGGLSLGFENRGFEVEYAFDIDQAAINTYKNNPSYHHGAAFVRDIYKVNKETIESDLGHELGTIDVVIGGPPCQGFSVQRRGDNIDPRNQLVLEYIRLLKEIKPRYFIMENVGGILSERGKPFVKALFDNMKEAGYTIQQKKLLASEYGVPQDRKRVIIVGEKTNGKDPQFSYPEPQNTPKKTVRDGKEWYRNRTFSIERNYRKTRRYNHGNLRQKEKRKHVCDSITICWLNFKWAEILQFCKTSARFLKVK